MSEKFGLSSEQEIVVGVERNLLLEAGAGSGKTFVIIQHLLTLLEKNILLEQLEESQTRYFLQSICLITFTKKAAQELRERIEDNIQSKVQGNEKWSEIYNNLNFVFIGTIHSLCFQILSEKGVLLSDTEICSEVYFERKIESSLEGFALENPSSGVHLNLDFFKKVMVSIFHDNSLRLNFDEPFKELESRWSEFFEIFKIDFSHFIEGESKWSQYALGIKVALESSSPFDKLQELFEIFKRTPAVAKKEKTQENLELSLVLKTFRSHYKKYKDIVDAYDLNLSRIKKQASVFQKLKKYIDNTYWRDRKITYDDLEYLSIENLNEFENIFQVVIVDEYQDLSWTQFEIVSHLSLRNAKRFLVGDHKQAIYSFRGGDLSVFDKTREEVEENFQLQDNYRSESEIIEFNNEVFSSLISNYQDQKSIKKGEGEVQFFSHTIEKDKVSASEMNSLEASHLTQEIAQRLDSDKFGSVAVIYRYLSPAMKLFRSLVKEGISVSMRLKINLKEDPLLNLFKILLRSKISQKEGNLDINSLIEEFKKLYSSLFDKDREFKCFNEVIENFIVDSYIYGQKMAFVNACCLLGINTAGSQYSLRVIEDILLSSKNNELDSLELLELMMNKTSPIQIDEFGKTKFVEITTSHSSKGLEYDCVFVAGLMTNGRSSQEKKAIFTRKESIRYLDENGERRSTPQYYIDEIIKKRSDLSESIRLFYVACTRAKKELNFFTVSGEGVKINKDSWASLLEQSNAYKHASNFVEKEISDIYDATIKPLFHEINFSYEGSFSQSLGLLPELSVVKLAKVNLCPYLFYLEEVLKFSEQEKELLLEIVKGDGLKNYEAGSSSKERGIEIHSKIEELIKHIDKVSPSEVDADLKIVYDFVLQRKSCEMYLEYDMRFKLFGFTISARADLIIKKGKTLEVVDFKTGLSHSEEGYKTQLALYAYAFSQVNNENYDSIELKIIYIDEQRIESFNFNKESLNLEISGIRKKLGKLGSTNLAHCHHCSSQSICTKKPIFSV